MIDRMLLAQLDIARLQKRVVDERHDENRCRMLMRLRDQREGEFRRVWQGEDPYALWRRTTV